MPKGATLKQAKNYLEKAEATTFRKTKYSNIGKITKSVSKDSLFLYSIVYYTSIFFANQQELYQFSTRCRIFATTVDGFNTPSNHPQKLLQYAALPLLKCGYTEETITNASPDDMNQYYSIEKQSKYGVVGIEIELL